MPQQTHAKVSQPAATRTEQENEVVDQAIADAIDRAVAEALVDETGDFLDEVDACLEENALEVVTRYVQRGGQ
jgi:ubiquitin-like protein Pup